MAAQLHTDLGPSGHGGNVRQTAKKLGVELSELFDFSANINPLGPPPWLRSLIARELDSIIHYPPPRAEILCEKIAEHTGVVKNQILAANGSTELLYILPRVINPRRLLIPVPSYIDYERIGRLAGLPLQLFFLTQESGFRLDCEKLQQQLQDRDLVIIGSPNNPTGKLVDPDGLWGLAHNNPQVNFVIDEAFLDFVDGGRSVAGTGNNIITLHSLTKFYGIPGLRLGYGVFPQPVADAVAANLPSWTVNSFAQRVGEQLLKDHDYCERSRTLCKTLRQEMVKRLHDFSQFEVFDSVANYLLLRLRQGTAKELAAKLLTKNILIRDCSNYHGLDHSYIRLAVRTEAENDTLMTALKQLYTPGKRRYTAGKTPSLMFQGTSSNAGKSVLTAAFCRICIKDGLRVAPFKAQNMSLNSYVTRDNLEMGRAQVVQAQAARLDPDVRMNPILIKPNSDTGSQIIVQGKSVGNMSVKEYVGYKKNIVQETRQSYDQLAAEYDLILMEGAGSPGEVNLKAHDIVNMQMARYAESPVLLVGDIDRGGVYASFVGTMEVLEQWERRLVAGFLVNRFRGDASLLQDAHDYVYNHTGKAVMGVVPFLKDLGLPEEDSVSFKAGLFNSDAPTGAYVEIVVLSLPHISNFTDLEPFLAEPDVHLRVVEKAAEIGQPDALILPGSKNVISDLAAISRRGIVEKVFHLAGQGCEIVGICGGYQMLGNCIADPFHIESEAGATRGLGLLDITTRLEADKHLRHQEGCHSLSGERVYGYEIHHGRSDCNDQTLLVFDDQRVCGSISGDNRIWGCYLHGIFDADAFRRWFIDRLRLRKGLPALESVQASYDLEPNFDRLADVVRRSVDIEKIYQLLRL